MAHPCFNCGGDCYCSGSWDDIVVDLTPASCESCGCCIEEDEEEPGHYDQNGLWVTSCYRCKAEIHVAQTWPDENEHLATGCCLSYAGGDFAGWICEECGDKLYQEGKAGFNGMNEYFLIRGE